MRGFWHFDRWTLDGKELVLPNGHRIELTHIKGWCEERLTGNTDLHGHWSGWRVRQQYLLAPGASHRSGTKITPATLRAFSRWVTGTQPERVQLELFDPLT